MKVWPLAAVGVFVLMLVGACAPSTSIQASTVASTPVEKVVGASTPTSSSTHKPVEESRSLHAPPALSWSGTLVARTSTQQVTVYDHAGFDSHSVVLKRDDITAGGSPLVFRVITMLRSGWLQVMLPVRPNGSTGWIRDDNVELVTSSYSIVVSLSHRTLTIYDNGNEVDSFPVAVGKVSTQTPVGDFYLVDKVKPPAGSIYGTYVMDLSAHSTDLQSFDGGDARIGIHGTDQPGLIGQDVSHGCIRMNDADVTKVVEKYGPLNGTPVLIQP